MREWKPISSVPRDGSPVLIRCSTNPAYGEQFMFWNEHDQQWEGRAFTAGGSVRTCWDKEAVQPDEWRTVIRESAT